MSPNPLELDAIDRAFRAISERARTVVSRVGATRVDVPPGLKKWSIGECLVHLALTSEAYLPVWRNACHDAHSRGLSGEAPFTLDFWGRTWVWFLEPPPKLRFPAPKRFRPLVVPPTDEVLPAFLACQDEVLQVIAAAKGLPLDRMKITSPFDRRVRYSVWSSFCANAAHQRRHLWQAERVADVLLP
jgi:hypothetical protein